MLKLQWQFEYRIIQYTKVQEDGMLKNIYPLRKIKTVPTSVTTNTFYHPIKI